MKKIMSIFKFLILFIFGGVIYFLIEILWRSYSHWTMFLLGGLCFVIVGAINNYIPWKMKFKKQMTIRAIIITILEFIVGVVVNLILKWNIWDYSMLPFNILGQISLPFSLIWFLLSGIIIIVDDYLRYKLFKEEKPKYTNWILEKIKKK